MSVKFCSTQDWNVPVSSRCESSNNVYVMSLYLKSNIIGKNDNIIPLTEKMDVLLYEYNKMTAK